MNVEFETVAAKFLFWENLFQIFGIGLCSVQYVLFKLVQCSVFCFV
jgi:hypothetical protein